MTRRTRLYIIDDSLTIRAMLQSLVEQDDAFEVCGLAADSDRALDQIAVKHPDIVLLDLTLRHGDGLSFLDAVSERFGDPWDAMKVIVVSSAATRNSFACAQAFERGAVACFDKRQVCSQASVLLSLLHDVSQDDVHADRYARTAVTLPDRDAAIFGFVPSAAIRLPDALTFI